MVFSVIPFIIGIILSRHLATNTKSYRAFISELESLISNNTNSENITKPEKKSYNIIKNITDFEYYFEKLLYIFPIIFFVFTVFFMIFSGGEDQYKLLSTTIFMIYNVTKILCIILSSICLVLSSIYFGILIGALKQYEKFVKEADECNLDLTLGIVFGFIGILYYLHLVCFFAIERSMMIAVGTVEIPGPAAKYDRNGNIIQKIVAPIVVVNANYQGQPQITTEIRSIEALQSQNQNIHIYQNQQNQQLPNVDSGTEGKTKNQ